MTTLIIPIVNHFISRLTNKQTSLIKVTRLDLTHTEPLVTYILNNKTKSAYLINNQWYDVKLDTALPPNVNACINDRLKNNKHLFKKLDNNKP